jgi:hypothetical protein
MANAKWSELQAGDFFTANINMGKDTTLYQKLDHKARPFNAVVVNKGDVCVIADSDFNTYERVQVTFEIKPTEY